MCSEDMQPLLALFTTSTPHPVFCIDRRGEIMYANASGVEFLRCWSCTVESAVLPTVKEAAFGPDRADLIEWKAASRLYAFSLVSIPEYDACFFQGRDITESRERLEELQRFSHVIEESINVVFIVDYEGRIEYVNRVFTELTGYSKEEALGEQPRFLASGETSLEQYQQMWKTIKSGHTWRGLIKNRRKDGTLYWAKGLVSPIKNAADDITHFMAIQEDVTDQLRAEQELQYFTEYDRVTGAVNRSRFSQLLDQHLNDLDESSCGALLLVDIDSFKLVNDSFGYDEGDQMLRNFADFLKRRISQIDRLHEQSGSMVGHLGADEFALFISACNEQEAVKTAENLRESVERQLFLNGKVRVTVSIGIALSPEHGDSSMALMAKASAAVERVKARSENSYMLFRQGVTRLEQAPTILEEKQQILGALEDDRFVPWFQPIMHVASRDILHYETLARMVAEDGQVVAPHSFIPTAESSGLIAEIDRVICEKAIKMQTELSSLGETLTFSVNLSGRNLGDADMLRSLLTMIEFYEVDPQCLVFEITETAAVQNMERAIFFVKALKDMGCRISLDDFGVGFTSFVHLLELDVDFLKIDGSFIRNLAVNHRDRVLVKTITDMANNLGIQTIAEFVNDQSLLPILGDFGVQYAQGFWVGKPSPERPRRYLRIEC